MSARTSLEYPWSTPPQPAQVLNVAEGVDWIRMPLPFALDHINLWLLEDAGGVAIVDAGLGNDVTRAIWDQLFAQHLAGRRITRVIATHLHPDHSGNASWLTERFAAPFYISQGDYLMAHAWRDQTSGYQVRALIDLFRQHGLGEEWITDIDTYRGTAYRQGVPEFPTRYRRLFEGDSLSIGGRKWRIIMGYGHAPEHASLYCDELRVLISGDMVLPRISTNVSVSAVNPDGNPLKRFIDSVKRHGELPDEALVLPSHGLPFKGLHLRVQQLVDHHDARFRELEDACAEPRTAAELIPTLFRRKLDAYGVFFAMGETLAHLNYLADAGRMVRVDAPDDRTRFVRAG
jgi:glyoxylase-like metal-dependent hydrolase (beta-lactamase superfamily II)